MIWRRQQVEDVALITLLDYRRQSGCRMAPPVDVDLIGEIACGLTWDWDVLPEPPGILIWAALFPSQARVVMNEAHEATFAAKSGLERFTKAHEIGHWVLHACGGVTKRGGNGVSEWQGERMAPMFHADSSPAHPLTPSPSHPRRDWIERHADWFAGALLMPASLFVPIAECYDLQDWKTHHELARLFNVTLSALRVRLCHLGLMPPGLDLPHCSPFHGA